MNPLNLFRRLREAMEQQRREAHSKWLRKNKVVMPKPAPDERAWSGAFMKSLKVDPR